MKKKRLGIPRALMYYRYSILWKKYFSLLGYHVIISPETNQEILSLGINNTDNECCLAYKIYIGHILYLSKYCDYILISRICDYGKKDKVCTRFNGTYDNVKTLLPKNQLLYYNIEHTHLKYGFIELLYLGLKITKNPLKVIYSYIVANSYQKRNTISRENEQKNKIKKSGLKVMIIAHDYIINDYFISNYIKEYLLKENIIIIYPTLLNKQKARFFSEFFSDTIYWKYQKEIIGALYYYNNQIDGVIYLSAYPCGIDALVNNLAMSKNNHIPTLNIIVDEFITNLNLETKLESFIDIIKKGIYEK